MLTVQNFKKTPFIIILITKRTRALINYKTKVGCVTFNMYTSDECKNFLADL